MKEKEKKVFQINSRIRVLDEEKQNYYHSTIQEVGPDSFYINEPLSTFREKLVMPISSRWNFHIIGDDALYEFNSTVVGYYQDQVMLVEIQYPAKISRWQRRQFFRFPCNLEMEYWVIDGSGEGQKGDISIQQASGLLHSWYQPLERERVKEKGYLQDTGELGPGYRCFTVDISGGGMQFTTSRRIPEGSFLLIHLNLGNDSLMLKGRVSRSSKSKVDGANLYRVGVEFTSMEEKVRDLIISYIFEEMRRRMSKE